MMTHVYGLLTRSSSRPSVCRPPHVRQFTQYKWWRDGETVLRQKKLPRAVSACVEWEGGNFPPRSLCAIAATAGTARRPELPCVSTPPEDLQGAVQVGTDVAGRASAVAGPPVAGVDLPEANVGGAVRIGVACVVVAARLVRSNALATGLGPGGGAGTCLSNVGVSSTTTGRAGSGRGRQEQARRHGCRSEEEVAHCRGEGGMMSAPRRRRGIFFLSFFPRSRSPCFAPRGPLRGTA